MEIKLVQRRGTKTGAAASIEHHDDAKGRSARELSLWAGAHGCAGDADANFAIWTCGCLRMRKFITIGEADAVIGATISGTICSSLWRTNNGSRRPRPPDRRNNFLNSRACSHSQLGDPCSGFALGVFDIEKADRPIWLPRGRLMKGRPNLTTGYRPSSLSASG